MAPVWAWMRRHKVWTAILIVVALGGIGALFGSNDSTSSSEAGTSSASIDSSSSEETADVVTGKIRGRFDRDALIADPDMVSNIATWDVWCGWRDGKVIVAVSMTNNSAEHVTVNWHPSYKIRNGSAHGTGLGAEQSDGFDSGETRYLEAEQEPEGVSDGTPIERCYPSFSVIEAG